MGVGGVLLPLRMTRLRSWCVYPPLRCGRCLYIFSDLFRNALLAAFPGALQARLSGICLGPLGHNPLPTLLRVWGGCLDVGATYNDALALRAILGVTMRVENGLTDVDTARLR